MILMRIDGNPSILKVHPQRPGPAPSRGRGLRDRRPQRRGLHGAPADPARHGRAHGVARRRPDRGHAGGEREGARSSSSRDFK